jgi:hypothetical protein
MTTERSQALRSSAAARSIAAEQRAPTRDHGARPARAAGHVPRRRRRSRRQRPLPLQSPAAPCRDPAAPRRATQHPVTAAPARAGKRRIDPHTAGHGLPHRSGTTAKGLATAPFSSSVWRRGVRPREVTAAAAQAAAATHPQPGDLLRVAGEQDREPAAARPRVRTSPRVVTRIISSALRSRCGRRRRG